MATTMVPPPAATPDVLPTDRLLVSGKAVPELRSELRRIPDWRNAIAVAGVWVQSLGFIVAAVWIGTWWSYLLCFCLMGRAHAMFASLMHESAHRLLFSNKKVNDFVGKWVVGYPAFTVTDLYRRGHMAHHKDEFGPNEPDMNLYVGYPVSRASLRRKLVRDAVGISGWKNLKGLFRGLRNDFARKHALRIIAFQIVFIAASIASGHWWVYWAMWFLPWMTQWRVINRLRAIAEHGGMVRSDDRRDATHSVRQHFLARFFMVPYNIGWHLSHHVDMGIPWRNLPKYHRELVSAGYVTPQLEYRSYPQLWKALGSGTAEGRMGAGRDTAPDAAAAAEEEGVLAGL
ncbi:MAG TPA: fatty acid desaturase family protein [Acidimicrobiales bacterium]|jgi:fatty acid desaturase|nr:fatty acid desaturase family protein [Acidimicrobiales bacterium]